MEKARKRKLGGAVYILPNLITTGNLFFGFFSVVKALHGQYALAAVAILIASIFDMVDGRVARLTGGTSEFGVQYDSLCDLISFGFAPAMLMYLTGLNTLGRVGWIIAFLYMACGALRLARFNVQSSIGKASGDFTGLPIPMAAAVIACFVLVWVDSKTDDGIVGWLSLNIETYIGLPNLRVYFLLLLGVCLALAMVSNLTYRSHKAIKIKGIRPFKFLVVAVVATGFVAYSPEFFGFLFFFFYGLSGLIEWALGWKKPIDDSDIFEDHPDEDVDHHAK